VKQINEDDPVQVGREIERLQNRLEMAREKERRTDELGGDTKLKIATIVHDLTCRLNHRDQCDWLYTSWSHTKHSRKRALAQVEYILKRTKIQPEELLPILEALKASETNVDVIVL
jgi:hypothetical protein